MTGTPAVFEESPATTRPASTDDDTAGPRDKGLYLTTAIPGRLSLCPCGSGKRYKDCCGKFAAAPLNSLWRTENLKQLALGMQRAGRYEEALAAYDQVLLQIPDDVDARHMRAVVLYQLGCMDESMSAFRELLAVHPKLDPAMWNNLGLTLAQALHPADDPSFSEKLVQYQRWSRQRMNGRHDDNPRISVVVASYNHAPYIERALRSVFAQTEMPCELIVIDDGSTDGSVGVIERVLRDAPFSTKLTVRSNHGAAQTLNEAIAQTSGDWIAVLNSDDYFAADRLQAMTETCCRDGIEWGFGQVEVIDHNGNTLDEVSNPFASGLRASANAVTMSPSVGLAFLRANPAISTGNLFFRKHLWQQIGGFNAWRYHHDWSFAFNASLLSEPVVVSNARYFYRRHESNTISETPAQVLDELRVVVKSLLALAVTREAWPNPFAPTASAWGRGFLSIVAGVGALELLPEVTINELWRALDAEVEGVTS